jgi:hypothetical protein
MCTSTNYTVFNLSRTGYVVKKTCLPGCIIFNVPNVRPFTYIFGILYVYNIVHSASKETTYIIVNIVRVTTFSLVTTEQDTAKNNASKSEIKICRENVNIFLACPAIVK